MSLSASTPPNWVDDRTALGRLIAAVLAVEPLRQLLFLQARRMMIRTAETRGIAWRQRREELRRQAEPLLEACTNPATQIPTYQEGNLCWLAACETEQATDSVALRVWKQEKQLTPEAAQARMGEAIDAAMAPSLQAPLHDALADWLERHGHGDVRVSGLDLSPQMLAVARVRDAGGRVHAWHHAAAEAIRAMPPPLATLLKSTEPYLEDYFRLDLPASLTEAGFVGLRRVASDHRHRVLVATRP
jgi:hypothetical protein